MEIRLCHILLIIFQDDMTIREKKNLPSVETYFHRSMILSFYVFLPFLSFENIYNRNATFHVYYNQTWLLSTYDKVVGLMSILMSNAWNTNMDESPITSINLRSTNFDKTLIWFVPLVYKKNHVISSTFDTTLVTV